MSNYLATRVVKVEVDWAYEKSDHASVMIEMHINEEIVMGPGLTKVNGMVLDNPVTLIIAKREILEMLNQIPSDWDPHKKLEYMKVAIRTVISGLVGKNRKELRKEIEELEEALNEMHELKVRACADIK